MIDVRSWSPTVTLSSHVRATPLDPVHLSPEDTGREPSREGGVNGLTSVFAMVVAITLPIELPHSVSAGALLALFLAPTIVPAVTRHPLGRWLARIALATVLIAPLITVSTLSSDHFRAFSSHAALTSMTLLIGLVVQIFAVAWACSVIGVARTALLYGITSTMNAAVHPASWGDNAWKYAFAWSISLVVISALARAPRVLQFLAIAVVSMYALTHDSRNSAGALLLAVLVTCLAYAVYRKSRRGRDIVVACLLGVCAFGIYSLVTQLALDGYLGQTLQRTQIGQSTSQIPMAGRPEYGATFALMHAKPMGLGPGVLPSGNDVQVGKTGLSNLGVVPNGSYVDGYMFQNAFEVHSVAGDLWVQFGIPGLILAGMILVALVRATLMMYRSKPSGDTALCLFLMFAALWDLLFSPLDANFRVVSFAAGVALWVISARTTTNATATTNATGRV